MKAPKNFYNTVDQSKLGIDDLFTRTAENEADITALETVVGDLNGGLVKDVHDLQDDSEHYHDDIADLKSADAGMTIQIAELEADILTLDGIVNAKETGTVTTYPVFNQITFSRDISAFFNILYNAGTNAVIIARSATGVNYNEVIFRPNRIGGDNSYNYMAFSCIVYSNATSKVVELSFTISSDATGSTVNVTQRNLT